MMSNDTRTDTKKGMQASETCAAACAPCCSSMLGCTATGFCGDGGVSASLRPGSTRKMLHAARGHTLHEAAQNKWRCIGGRKINTRHTPKMMRCWPFHWRCKNAHKCMHPTLRLTMASGQSCERHELTCRTTVARYKRAAATLDNTNNAYWCLYRCVLYESRNAVWKQPNKDIPATRR